MVDADAVILDELGRLAALGGFESADWADVLRRANVGRAPSRRRRRRLVVALSFALVVLAVAVSPLGAAIGREFGNFSDWLSGSPGKPASSVEQGAFARATRSWFGFPAHTELRRLIVSEHGDLTAELYGFRSSDALCVRLVASGSASNGDLACAPLRELRARRQPALVLASDYGVGPGRKTLDGPLTTWTPKAAVTFGVLADGVKTVLIGRSDGTVANAIVNGDAFLSITHNPSPELRVTHVWVIRSGKRVAIPFVPASTPLRPFSLQSAHRQPSGPAKVQRELHSGAIGWFARRKLRGQPVPRNFGRLHLITDSRKVVFARMVTPDLQAPERVVISLLPAGHRYFGGRLHNNNQVCAEVVGGVYSAGQSSGGGCWPAGRLFSTGPFTESVTQSQNQYATVSGVASDDVARMRLYLSSGAYVPVPLADNVYVVHASLADYPLRLVGYDTQGRVIGSTTLWGNTRVPLTVGAPAQGAVWRTVIHNKAGVLMTAPSASGGICFGVRYSPNRYGNGGAYVDCSGRPSARHMQMGASVERDGVAISGQTGSAIADVVVTMQDGSRVMLKPVRGYVMALLRGPIREIVTVTGVDRRGRAVATEHWRP
jgi:hypothetical protein